MILSISASKMVHFQIGNGFRHALCGVENGPFSNRKWQATPLHVSAADTSGGTRSTCGELTPGISGVRSPPEPREICPGRTIDCANRRKPPGGWRTRFRASALRSHTHELTHEMACVSSSVTHPRAPASDFATLCGVYGADHAHHRLRQPSQTRNWPLNSGRFQSISDKFQPEWTLAAAKSRTSHEKFEKSETKKQNWNSKNIQILPSLLNVGLKQPQRCLVWDPLSVARQNILD